MLTVDRVRYRRKTGEQEQPGKELTAVPYEANVSLQEARNATCLTLLALSDCPGIRTGHTESVFVCEPAAVCLMSVVIRSVCVKWRTVWPSIHLSHKMASLFFSISLSFPVSPVNAPTVTAAGRTGSGPRAGSRTLRSAVLGTDTQAREQRRRGLATRTRRGSSGHERLESAQTSPRKRRP